MKTIKKIFDFFDEQEKRQFFFLLLLILIVAFFEILVASSIFFFITLISNQEFIKNNLILSLFYNYLKIFNLNQFTLIFGLGVITILFLSLLIKAITQYNLIRFALIREFSISKTLINYYFNQPYLWFLNRHSADLSKLVLSEVGTVVNQAILSTLIVISQGIISLSLIIFIIIIDPYLAINISLFFFFSYLCIFFILKKTLSDIGSKRVKANHERFKILSESFNAIKDIKLKNFEKIFIKRFANFAKNYAEYQSLSQIIGQIPRYLIEALAFGGVISLLIFLVFNGNNLTNIAPVLSVYLFAGYRLIPSAQNIYNSITQINFTKSTLENLHKDWIKCRPSFKVLKTQFITPLKNSIELKNIYFHFKSDELPILKNINLKILAFSKIGIIGSTGSGKTTLIDIISGLIDPSSGTIKIDKNILNKYNKSFWQKELGYVTQKVTLFDESIAANIALGINKENINFDLVKWAAKISELDEFVTTKLSKGYDTIIGEQGVKLSGGERQRIGLARALYNKPKVLILDEATNSLDNFTARKIIKNINQIDYKLTLIIVSHQLDILRYCDTIYKIDRGKIKKLS